MPGGFCDAIFCRMQNAGLYLAKGGSGAERTADEKSDMAAVKIEIRNLCIDEAGDTQFHEVIYTIAEIYSMAVSDTQLYGDHVSYHQSGFLS